MLGFKVSGFTNGFGIQGSGLKGSSSVCAPINFSNGFYVLSHFEGQAFSYSVLFGEKVGQLKLDLVIIRVR